MTELLSPLRSCALLILAACSVAPLPPQAAGVAEWIWSGGTAGEDGARRWFRRSFRIDGVVERGRLTATCDNHCEVWINGERVFAHGRWEAPREADVRERLREGDNVIAVAARNDGGPAGLVCRLEVVAGARAFEVVSDERWRASDREIEGWKASDFDDGDWPVAESLGPVGAAGLPWSGEVGGRLFGVAARPVAPQAARVAEAVAAREGFAVELVWSVPRSQGSWVCVTNGPDGRLFASDQKNGLFVITPAKVGDPAGTTTVEQIDVPLGGAQGLLWAFDSLYAVVNGRGSGLYRIRDTDGDARLDRVELLRELRGAGEHGPHAVVLAPDGESLFVIAGNHTMLTEIASSRLPQNWGEDQLLPRQWDPRGHAKGRLAPGGWICRVDPDGREWELWGAGFRNAYDIAFNDSGDLFTYDADMEWDFGLPWYRPTRICHVPSGAEFGWRSGSGKWPSHVPDSLPATVDVGPGSPTGVVFGSGAKFPERYQRALFALDWTFGTIWAVHLEADGATWRGEKEEFVTGQPLAVSDAVVGADGALYFTVGGRSTASALYRVVYRGDESVAEAAAAPAPASAETARARRRQLENYHGRQVAGAVDAAWPHLRDEDRFVRYAARLAIEAQPVGEWRDRALAERDPRSAVEALLALARQGSEVRGAILGALARFDLATLPSATRLAALRVVALTFIRSGAPDDAQRRDWSERLAHLYPSSEAAVDADLAALLVYLDAPGIVEKTVPLLRTERGVRAPDWAARLARNEKYGGILRRMIANPPPTDALRLAWSLRNIRYGWTLEQRREYFAFLESALDFSGGESYRGFLEAMRDDALAQCSPAEREILAGETPPEREPEPLVPPNGPGQVWTVDAAMDELGDELRGRDFDRGRQLFRATQCVTCHRFDGEGGGLGPDLSSVASRFGRRDLLAAILEPNAVVSDQYAATIVETDDGDVHVGRVVEVDEETVEVHTADVTQAPIRVARSAIARERRSPQSIMPAGLVNTCSTDELRDLVAYLLSRGNRADPMFDK